MSKIRPFIKYHGGKNYLAKDIIAFMHPHRVYIEGCIGGASVLLNKPPSEVEFANDINKDIFLLYSALQKYPRQVKQLLSEARHSQEAFDKAGEYLIQPASLSSEFAANYIIRNRMSRGGLMKNFSNSTRQRGGQDEGQNSWQNFVADFDIGIDRIKNVIFTCMNIVDIMEDINKDDVLFYLDPPYIPETRTVKKVYKNEMDIPTHIAMLEFAQQCFGQVIISGYNSDTYEQYLNPWHGFQKFLKNMPNNSGQNKVKQRRVEAVWSNRTLPDGYLNSYESVMTNTIP